MKGKSIQEFDSDQEKIIFSLLKEGRTINEVFNIINIPIHHHQKRLENNPNYKKEINNLKSNNCGYEKYLLLSLLTKNKSNVKDLNKTYSNEIKKYKNDKVFSVLWNMVEKKIVRSKNPIHKFDDVSKNEKVFRYKNKVVGIVCNCCLEHLDPSHFHRKNSHESGYNTVCINCTTLKRVNRKPFRRGEYYEGEKIKKYNSVGNTIDRKCPKCQSFKSYKKFSHLYLGIYVCDDCYVVKNNSKLVKSKVEFFKGVQIRKYDDNSMVTHKLCSKCFVMKNIDDFTVNNLNKVDGRSNNCKSCYSEYQKLRKQMNNNLNHDN
jgi:hypothetical protein